MNSPLENAPPPQQEWPLASYLAAIRAHALIVTLVTLAAVGAAVAFLQVRSPEYEATADLLVEAVPQDDETYIGLPLLRDTGDPVRTVQTAAALIESQGTGFGDDVEVNPEGESNILAVTATADSPEEAARIANEFANEALAARAERLAELATPLIDQLEATLRATPAADQVTRAELATRIDAIRSVVEGGDPTLSLSQEALPPTSATGASPALVLILAGLAGFTLGAATAVILELINRRIRDEDEAVAVFPLPVLARVPILPGKSRRGPPGSSWYMPPGIREPFRTLVAQLEQRGRRAGSMLVTSATRGDGKTTSTINLAITLAATGKRVIVLDFDLRNPQVAPALRIDDGPTLSELLNPKLKLERLLVRPSDLRTLRILPVRFDPEEVHLAEAAGWRLPELIQEARAIADYVVVDTPPLGEVSDALSLAPLVDDILIVMRPGNTGRSQLAGMRELLERIGRSPDGCIMIGVAEPFRGYYSYGAGGAPDLVLGAGDSKSTQAREREEAGVARDM